MSMRYAELVLRRPSLPAGVRKLRHDLQLPGILAAFTWLANHSA